MLCKHALRLTKFKVSTLLLALCLLPSAQAAAQTGDTGPCYIDGFGGQLFANGEAVRVIVEAPTADFTSDIRLVKPQRKARLIASNRDVGAVVNLGNFFAGEELVFAIAVRETGERYENGPASRNPDRIVHASVQCLGQREARVLFEDRNGGGDFDFNDAIIKVRFGEATPNRQLRRSMAMGPLAGPGNIGNYSDILFTPDPSQPDLSSNIALLKNSNTRVVRLWADWPTMQPNRSNLERDIETDCQTERFIHYLDNQITTARREGFKVILTSYRFPLWVNYTPGDLKKAGYDMRPPAADGDLCPLPRCTRATNSACEGALAPSPQGPVLNEVPDENKLRTYWARWINFLVRRYGYSHETKGSGRYVDFLEVSNEPNNYKQMWPQQDGRGRLIMPDRIAVMFRIAQRIVQERNEELIFTGLFDEQHPTTLVLAGPATEDSPRTNTSRQTSYRTFTVELLRRLRDVGFDNADPNFAWSVHNYADVTYERDCDPQGEQCPVIHDDSKINAAAWVRSRIIEGVRERNEEFPYRWLAWPGSGRPSILITEGGARLNQIDSGTLPLDKLKDKQADLVAANFFRMYYGPLSRGIALVSEYFTYTDPCSDSGTHDFIYSCVDWAQRNSACGASDPCTGEGGHKRRLYDVWAKLPTAP